MRGAVSSDGRLPLHRSIARVVRQAPWLASPAVWLSGLIAASIVLRAWAGTWVPTPWINADEVIYAELGRSLFSSGHLSLLGQPINFYSLVYPALIGLPLQLGDIDRGYALAKALQAVVMSLTAVPVYLWSRSLMPRSWAVLSAALCLALPGLAYAGLLMSEVAFYPLVTVTAWLMAVTLTKPTIRSQSVLVAAIAVTTATRLQGLILPVVFCVAALVKLGLDRGRLRDLRAFTPTLVGLSCLIGLWIVWRLGNGRPTTELLGAYRAAGETSYSFATAVRFVLYHAADLLLVTVFIPACAVAVLFVDAVRRREPEARVRAYLAVTVALSSLTLLEVGLFASRHVGRLAERNLLAAVPPIFIGFVLWVARGTPRPRFATPIVALLAAALIVYLPAQLLVSPAAIPDAFSLVPLISAQRHFPRANLDLLLVDAAAVALALFVFCPRRYTWVLPSVVLAVLASVSLAASMEIETQARQVERGTLDSDPRWIDDSTRSPVAFVYSGELPWTAVYENVFWNRRITSVVTLPSFQLPGPVPQSSVGVARSGRLVSPATARNERYVVAARSILFVGDRVAHTGASELALWRLAPPARLSAWVVGLTMSLAHPGPDVVVAPGDLYAGLARLVVYRCTGGVLRIAVSTPEGTAIVVRRDNRVVATALLGAGEWWTRAVRVPASPPETQCEFDLSSSLGARVEELSFVRARA